MNRQIVSLCVLGVVAFAGSAARAALLQIDFSVHFNRAFNTSTGGFLPADLTVTGAANWESTDPAFSTNGVNARFFPYQSFGVTGVGTVTDGGPVDMAFSAVSLGSPTGANALETVHIPSQSASNLHWAGDADVLPAGFSSGSFQFNSFRVAAMPLFTSPLPSDPAQYTGLGGFGASYTCNTTPGAGSVFYFFDQIDFIHAVVSVVPAPSTIGLIGACGLLAVRRRR